MPLLLSLPLLFSPDRGFPFSEFYHRPQVGIRWITIIWREPGVVLELAWLVARDSLCVSLPLRCLLALCFLPGCFAAQAGLFLAFALALAFLFSLLFRLRIGIDHIHCCGDTLVDNQVNSLHGPVFGGF